MKKRIKNIIKVTLISPELLSIFLVYIFSFIFKDIVLEITNYYIINNNNIELLFTIPGLCLTFALVEMNNILSSDEEIKKIAKWENYKLLKDECYVAIFWILLSIVVTIFIIVKMISWAPISIGSTYIAFIVSGIISTITLYNAKINMKQLINKIN